MTIKEQIIAEVQRYREIAASKGYDLPDVPIDFSLKGACAGQAVTRRFMGTPVKLRFNLAIAERHPEEFLKRTCPHEVAHLLQYKKNPNAKPHGREWDFFCRLLTGSTMPRCHTYDVTGIKRTRNVKRFQYVCNCENRTHKVSTTIHKRIEAGRIYTCKSCGSDIRRLVASLNF